MWYMLCLCVYILEESEEMDSEELETEGTSEDLLLSKSGG